MDLMSERQWKRWDVIGRVNAEKLTMAEAARIGGLSLRQLWRIRAGVAEMGKEALFHGNRGRSPANRTDEAVREKVMNAASYLLEAAPADLTAHDGRITVVGTDRSVSFREVARAVYSEMGRLPPEARGELAATKTYDPVFGTTTCATHIASLEIDPASYEVKLGRYVVAEDCGKIINPQIVDGQVHGGVAQGIGAALYEEVVYDNEGQLHTASLVDYLVPAASEIPPMQVVHLDTVSPPASFLPANALK